ncbi:hypothetical protein JB92DRAFT_3065997 [Gautieria morchelliformis]|nr:hypothetical protein JB92DRAFT_3065997 [Gautieria morchelliformis]
MEPQSPTEPPPPAYESEHDFDRKLSDVLERSLTLQQPAALPDEDEWEEWDEARFEAAAALARANAREQGGESDEHSPRPHTSEKQRLASDQTSGEASSSTSSAPVRRPSRRLPVSPPAKERPSWYAEAQLDASAGSGSSQITQAVSPPRVHNIPPEEEDPADEPLPPFAAVGPSLEALPFEEVVRPLRILPASNIDSPPQSPLDGVDSNAIDDPPPFASPSSHRVYDDRYRSTSPRQSVSPSIPRSPPVRSAGPPPSMRFDPSVAYAKARNANILSQAESREPVDASAFYNSAVSSLLGSSQTVKRSTNLPTNSFAYRPGVHDPRSPSPIPPIPLSSSQQHSTLPHNPYYPGQIQPFGPHQHGPPPPPAPQQYQHVVPGFGVRPVGPPTPAPPPPPHWPHGGYGR